MSRRFFGTDGIRGKVGEPPITADFMMRLGHAVGCVLRRSGLRPTVLVGKDTRLSGYMIEAALEAGFTSAGVDVVLTGPLPTPGVAYLTRALRCDLGVVISASHNLFGDNGVKFFSAQGAKLPDDWERQVEALLDEPPSWAQALEVGRARRIDHARGRYIEFCKSTVANDFSLRGLRIVVDAAHGAAYHVAPDVFHEMGAEVNTLGCQPNGTNINAGVGATSPDALRREVKACGADLGIALDGDADRLVMVDAEGRLYDGDMLLYILAQDRLQQGQPLPGVVGTLMTNLGIEQALAARGVALVRAKVGDRYVLEELLARGWVLGGEGSGHLLALDRHSTGDGIVSALQVLQALRGRRSLHAMLDGVTLSAQALRAVPMALGSDWRSNRRLVEEQGRVERELGASGRILIRPSGTEPVLRVMVETADRQRAEHFADRLAAACSAA